MPVFQPNVPTGSVPLNQDYLNLQGNNQQLDIAFGVDHTPFSNTSGIPPGGVSGMHKAIHMIPQSPPTALSGYGQLFNRTFNDGIANDQTLYFLTGGNRLLRLTRNFLPVSATNGYTFLPGGLIYQWGRLTTTGALTNLLFVTGGLNINFPSANYNVQITPTGSSLNNDQQYKVVSNSTTGFDLGVNVGYPTGSRFFWTAIGI